MHLVATQRLVPTGTALSFNSCCAEQPEGLLHAQLLAAVWRARHFAKHQSELVGLLQARAMRGYRKSEPLRAGSMRGAVVTAGFGSAPGLGARQAEPASTSASWPQKARGVQTATSHLLFLGFGSCLHVAYPPD